MATYRASNYRGRFTALVDLTLEKKQLPADVADQFENDPCLVSVRVEFEYWPPDYSSGCLQPYLSIEQASLEDTDQTLILYPKDQEAIVSSLWRRMSKLWQDLEDDEISRRF
jgi:hypothetical protein